MVAIVKGFYSEGDEANTMKKVLCSNATETELFFPLGWGGGGSSEVWHEK